MIKRLKGIIILILFLLLGCNNKRNNVNQIILSKNKVDLYVDESLLINAEVLPLNSDNKIIKWTSSHPNIVSVLNGKITAVAPGVATVYAKVGKKIAICRVNVNKVEYDIIFNSNGGSKVPTKKVYDGDTIFRPSHPEKYGYIFNGWYTDNNLRFEFSFNTEIKESMTLYAKWIPKKYKITFESDSPSEINPLLVEYNQYATKPIDPIKEGYEFCGWYKDKSLQTKFNFSMDMIYDNITLYAKWRVLMFQVTYIFNNNNQNYCEEVQWNTITKKPPNPDKKGHTFIGWYSDSNLKTIFNFNHTKIKCDTNLYAKWKINKHIISYNTNGGSEICATVVDWNTYANYPLSPIKDGHTFMGWYLDNNFHDLYSINEPITSDLTIYAKWKINTYKVTFISDNDIYIPLIEVQWNQLISEPGTPIKRGYIFTGWFLNLVDFTPFIFTEPIKNNTIIYAKWEENPWISLINFNLNGGRWSIDSFHGFIDEESKMSCRLGTYNVKLYDDNLYYKSNLMLYSKDCAEDLLTNSSDTYKIGIKHHINGYYYVDGIFQEFLDYNFNDYDYTLLCNESYLDGYAFIRKIVLGEIITIEGSTLANNQELTNSFVKVYSQDSCVYVNDGLFNYLDLLPIPVKEGYQFIGWFNGNSFFDKATSNMNLYASWEYK